MPRYLLSIIVSIYLLVPSQAVAVTNDDVAGIWEGTVRSGGVVLNVTFDAKQEGDHVEGCLTVGGASGISKHFVSGEFTDEANIFHLHDTKVEKMSGMRKFEPALMDDYELRLRDKGTSLVGSFLPASGNKRISMKLRRRKDTDGLHKPRDPNDERSRAYLERTKQAFELGEQAKKLVIAEKYSEAENIYRKAVELDPNKNSASIHCDLGVVLEMQHNYQPAMAEFEKAIELKSVYPTASFNVATCHLNSGNLVEAKTRLTKFLKDYPEATEKAEAARLLDLLNNPSKCDASDGKLKPILVASKPAEKVTEEFLVEPAKTNLPDGKIADQMDAASDDYVGKSADYYSRAVANGTYRWRKEDLPIKVYIESGEGVAGYREAFKELLIESFDDWMEAGNHRLSWQLVPTKEEAKVVCGWISDKKDFLLKKFLEQGETHLNGYYDEKGNELGFVESAKITICTSSVFGIKPLKDKDIKQICRHEVGHALGIYGHSPHSKDVMYPTATGVFSVKELTPRDVETINRLYANYAMTADNKFVVRGGEM